MLLWFKNAYVYFLMPYLAIVSSKVITSNNHDKNECLPSIHFCQLSHPFLTSCTMLRRIQCSGTMGTLNVIYHSCKKRLKGFYSEESSLRSWGPYRPGSPRWTCYMSSIYFIGRMHCPSVNNEVRNQRNRWSTCNRFTWQKQVRTTQVN